MVLKLLYFQPQQLQQEGIKLIETDNSMEKESIHFRMVRCKYNRMKGNSKEKQKLSLA